MPELDQYKQTFQGVCDSLDNKWPAGCMDFIEENAPDIYRRIQEALHEIDTTWGKDWGPFAQALFRWRVACTDAIKKFND